MAKPQEQPKKCFCTRCFLPIDAEDKVEVEGQNFHRQCCTCCVCRTIPTSLKMFYGHVFCSDCFKAYVLNRFKGEAPRMYSNSWWMQWAPGTTRCQHVKEENEPEKSEESKPADDESPSPEQPAPRRCICARCLQAVDEKDKVEIGGQNFHCQCARCYCCHCVPKDNVKIYYGQVFCEDCFQKHVLSRNNNPAEFFKNCFDHWQNSPQFSEQMKEFMTAGNTSTCPMMFMMQQPPIGCGGNESQQEWFQKNEKRKSATPPAMCADAVSCDTRGLSFEFHMDEPKPESGNESANTENFLVATAAEKIEKLTKYLHESSEFDKLTKKWKNFFEPDKCRSRATSVAEPSLKSSGWVDLQDCKIKSNDLVCPKCLWQCGGPIFVNSECLSCGDYSSFE